MSEVGKPVADCGVIYVASGRRHLDEMLVSVRSLREQMPGLPVVLCTDQTRIPAGVFDEIRVLRNPRHSFVDKIAPLCESPFARTLFLDTDTFLCRPVGDLFDLLERFDLAVTHAPFRHDRPFSTPTCFAELNTGVMVYRNTEAVRGMFQLWLELYAQEVAETGKLDSDQPAFRAAVYQSPLVSLYVLPSEYNLRTVMPASVGRGSVRILHGRAPDMAAVAERVNSSRKIRVLLPGVSYLIGCHLQVLGAGGRLIACLFDLLIRPWIWLERVLRPIKRKLFP
jgi:hypothetical protein